MAVPARWLAALTVLFLLGFGTPAQATPLGDNAALGTDVSRWSPAEGALASSVVARIRAVGDSWIGLGYDQHGFWSVETVYEGMCNDNGTSYVTVARTGFDGKRKTFPIGTTSDSDATLRAGLFRVAKGPLDVARLRQDYRMSLPKHDGEGRVDAFSGWFVTVTTTRSLRFGMKEIVSEGMGCCGRGEWHAYPLAGPAKSKR